MPSTLHLRGGVPLADMLTAEDALSHGLGPVCGSANEHCWNKMLGKPRGLSELSSSTRLASQHAQRRPLRAPEQPPGSVPARSKRIDERKKRVVEKRETMRRKEEGQDAIGGPKVRTGHARR